MSDGLPHVDSGQAKLNGFVSLDQNARVFVRILTRPSGWWRG